MRAPLEICRKRTVCAVLASGVVISLTALTGGIAPAFAEPGTEPVVPTTTIAPEPTVAVTQAPVEQSTAAQIPSPVEAPPVVVPTVQQTVEAPPQTRAPEPVAPAPEPVVTSARPAPPSAAATSTAAPSSSETPPPPVTSATKSPTTSDPVTTTGATPPSPQLAPPASSATETSEASSSSASSTSKPSESSSAEVTSSESSEPSSPSSSSESARNGSASPATSATSSAAEATPRVIEKVAPQTLDAPEEDVQIAKTAKVVEAKPVEAPKQEIQDVSRVIDLPNRDRDPFNKGGQRNDDKVQLAGGWDRNVRQWRPDWVEYDEYYRPVLSNPYRDPVRIVYVYQDAPRVVWIPPLARIVLEVAQYAAYSFTAVVTNTINQAVNVAVGSFFGGGYFPGVGLPLPPPPPALLNYANVPVQVRYPDATYQPFRVNKIVDVGPDRQYGEQKVLLDGVTPAWGQWKQSPSGERSFEVHKTQQFPGLDDPRPGPLPGDYQLTLASDQSPAGINKRDVYLIAVAVACGALSIGAVILAVLMGRRRRPQH
jgi:hypothetical protein